jgi:transposase
LRFLVTSGECSDFTQALPLLAQQKTSYVLADRGYDSDEIVQYIENNLQAQAVIPPRKHRKIQRPYDRVVYKARNTIERLFSRLKQFRRIATRYDKLKSHFVSFISLACAWILLSANVASP